MKLWIHRKTCVGVVGMHVYVTDGCVCVFICVCVYFILAKSKTIKVYEQCPRVVDVDLKLTVIICK